MQRWRLARGWRPMRVPEVEREREIKRKKAVITLSFNSRAAAKGE